MLKLYKEFINYNNLYNIIKQLENRIFYWFSEGALSKESKLIDISSTVTDKYKNKSIILNFSNELYMYQCLITIDSEKDEDCYIILKRYDLSDQTLIDSLKKDVKINNIKEDTLISMIGDIESKDNNPEKNKIEIEKDKESENEDDNKDDSDKDDEPNEEIDETDFKLGGNQNEFEF